MLARPESRSLRSFVALLARSGAPGRRCRRPPPRAGGSPVRRRPSVDLTNADRCDFLDPAQCLLPWPNDYFTVSRPPQRDRPAPQHLDRLGAAQQERRADRSDRAEPVRRLQPGQHDHHEGARPRHPRGVQADRRRAGHGHRPHLRPQAADRGHQHAHEEAAPDLVGARRQPDQSGRREPADPPRRELRRGHALHRRAAQPQGLRRQHAPGVGRLQALPRRPAHEQLRDRAAPPAHGVDLPDALAGRHRAPRPLPGLGLHGLLRAQPHPARARRSATTPSASSATTTSATCASRATRRSTRSRASPTSPPAGRRLPGRRGRRARAARRGHGQGALLSRPARLPARLEVQLRERLGSDPDADPGQHHRRAVHLQHPALGRGRPRRQARAARRSTATACSAIPTR